MITWQNVLITVLTSAGVASLLQFILQKTWFSRIEHGRQTALEAYKHELARLSEKEKFDYQRWMTDFTIYTQKKHGVYSELYKLILVADGSLEGIIGFRSVPSFEEYSRTPLCHNK